MSGSAKGQRPLRLNCDRLWTQLVTVVYRLRRKPRVSSPPPLHKS